jgi:hypothetical protein
VEDTSGFGHDDDDYDDGGGDGDDDDDDNDNDVCSCKFINFTSSNSYEVETLVKNIKTLPVVTSSDVDRFFGARGQLLRWTHPKEVTGFQKNHIYLLALFIFGSKSLRKMLRAENQYFFI